MEQILLSILIFSTGVLISGGLVWVSSYYPILEPRQDKVKIEDILIYSDKVIPNEKFFCEGLIHQSVGAVTGSIIRINSLFKRNMQSLDCSKNTCTLAVSSCMPWQDQECGERILKFDINSLNEIQPQTFMCIDVP